MNYRQAKRTTRTLQERPATASIIRFPRGAHVQRIQGIQGIQGERHRPSLALNIALVLLLVLVCVIWEALSARIDNGPGPRHSQAEAPSLPTV